MIYDCLYTDVVCCFSDAEFCWICGLMMLRAFLMMSTGLIIIEGMR